MQDPNRVIIMFVDDDDAACDIYSHHLERFGYRVVCVQRGTDVLVRALQHRPDLIIMDLNLPGQSGSAATRQLKAERATASIPVIALTGNLSGSVRREALAAGCADVIVKPFPPEQLVALIREFLTPADA